MCKLEHHDPWAWALHRAGGGQGRSQKLNAFSSRTSKFIPGTISHVALETSESVMAMGASRERPQNVNESEGESVRLPTGNRWHTCTRMTRGGTTHPWEWVGHDNSAVAGASPPLGPKEGDQGQLLEPQKCRKECLGRLWGLEKSSDLQQRSFAEREPGE